MSGDTAGGVGLRGSQRQTPLLLLLLPGQLCGPAGGRDGPARRLKLTSRFWPPVIRRNDTKQARNVATYPWMAVREALGRGNEAGVKCE